jgi:HD-like signal output (HDOD) protein
MADGNDPGLGRLAPRQQSNNAPRPEDDAFDPAANELALSIRDLPTLPNTVMDVIRVANDSYASAQDLERVVSRDMTLAARVLKISNSAAFGMRRRIETTKHAVLILGTRRIRSIVSAMSLAPMFETAHARDLISGPQLWAHALACAMWTQHLADRLQYIYWDQVFMAGLMHDIGIVVLFQSMPERYTEVLQLAKDRRLPLEAVEEHLLGTTHARVAGHLCVKWMLTPNLTNLLARHHSPEMPEKLDAQLLRLADFMAGHTVATEFTWEEPRPIPAELLTIAGLSQDDIREVIEQGQEDVIRQVKIFLDT